MIKQTVQANGPVKTVVCCQGHKKMERDNAGAISAQSFAYEIRKDSAVIWRCFSRDTRAEIPERINGFPVTELVPYAFSAHMDDQELGRMIESGTVLLYVPEAAAGTPLLDIPALCGDALEEICLPRAMRRVGRYCFYDCRNLEKLEFHGELTDWGSGVFTRCHRIRALCVHTDEQGSSYLKDVLDELPEMLEVTYICPGGNMREQTAAEQPNGKTQMQEIQKYTKAKLIFPEFYEEGVENTPARILETHVHGSGISYRNCFQGRCFDFTQYDALFPHARALESNEVVARMVIGRLQYPAGLTDKARETYETYVAEHETDLGRWFLKQKDMDSLRWLLNRSKQADPLTDELLPFASRLHNTEAVSYLMNRKLSHSRAGGRRRMEL